MSILLGNLLFHPFAIMIHTKLWRTIEERLVYNVLYEQNTLDSLNLNMLTSIRCELEVR